MPVRLTVADVLGCRYRRASTEAREERPSDVSRAPAAARRPVCFVRDVATRCRRSCGSVVRGESSDGP